MHTMSGCANYKSICNVSTPAPTQCSAHLSPKLPTTNMVQTSTAALCTASKASSCPACTGTSMSGHSMAGMPGMRSAPSRRASYCTDYTLDLFSEQCLLNPFSASCAEWKAWCDVNANLTHYCKKAATAAAAATRPPANGAAIAVAAAAAAIAGLMGARSRSL
jgi:hypothetical protein